MHGLFPLSFFFFFVPKSQASLFLVHISNQTSYLAQYENTHACAPFHGEDKAFVHLGPVIRATLLFNLSRNIVALQHVAQSRTEFYFVQHVGATCNTGICCETSGARGSNTGNNSFNLQCSNVARQVEKSAARLTGPLYVLFCENEHSYYLKMTIGLRIFIKLFTSPFPFVIC